MYYLNVIPLYFVVTVVVQIFHRVLLATTADTIFFCSGLQYMSLHERGRKEGRKEGEYAGTCVTISVYRAIPYVEYVYTYIMYT